VKRRWRGRVCYEVLLRWGKERHDGGRMNIRE